MRGAAILAIVALSLGIGATTTMFSVVDATLWRPMPLERSDRLAVVSVTKTTARDGLQRLRWSRPGIAELEAATTSFESIASVTLTSITIQIPQQARTRHRTRHAPDTRHQHPALSTQHPAPRGSRSSGASRRRSRLPAVLQDAAHRASGRTPVSSRRRHDAWRGAGRGHQQHHGPPSLP